MTDSPDGLGERLRDEAKVRELAGHPAGTRLAHEAALFREAAARIDSLTEQARIEEHILQNITREATRHALAHERLLSENARLTEQVRGAEGVVTPSRRALDVGAYMVGNDGGWRARCCNAPWWQEKTRHEDNCWLVELRSALSIYDEGAAGVKSVTEEKKS